MLGRLRMSVSECLMQYETFGAKIFGKPRWLHARTGFILWDRPKYSSSAFRAAIGEVVRQKRNPETGTVSLDGSGTWKTFAQPDPKACKT